METFKKGDKVITSNSPNGYTTHPNLLYTQKTFNKPFPENAKGVIVGDVTNIIKPGRGRKCFAIDVNGDIFYIMSDHLFHELVEMTLEERMEGLANLFDLETFKAKLHLLKKEWLKEGFEKDDIKKYINKLIEEI